MCVLLHLLLLFHDTHSLWSVCFTRYGAWILVGGCQRIMLQPIGLPKEEAFRIIFQAYIDAFQSSENLGGGGGGGGGIFILALQRPSPPTSTN